MADHVHESLLAYVDGELGAPERAEVDRHVAECEACRAELASIERAHAALQTGPWPSAPPDTARRAILRATTRPSTREWLAEAPSGVRWGSLVAVAAAAVFLVFGRSREPGSPNAGVVAPLSTVTDSATRFLLVLHAPTTTLSGDSQSVAVRRRDYATWRASMVQDPRFVSSAQLTREPSRLARESRVLLSDDSPLWTASQQMQGFLIVRARDVVEAAEIARQSPHVRYGGTITVRQIASGRRQ